MRPGLREPAGYGKGEDGKLAAVIAFTKDWSDVPTCTTHILRLMARSMRVLWVNSIGIRDPRLFSTRDLYRMGGRACLALRGPKWQENHLWVLSPILVPKASGKCAIALNRLLVRWYTRRERDDCSAGIRELWAFVPNAVDFVGCAAEQKVVYYCVDDWTNFDNLDAEWVSRKEQELLSRADVVFATSRYLESKCRSAARGPVHYSPHGVDHGVFARALDAGTPVPTDISGVNRPVIGYYGNVRSWIDFELVAQIASARPGWSFVFVGPVLCDVGRTAGLANVRFLGRREYVDLPRYCKAFDAAIVPYDTSQPKMASVNPVKARELLAAGVPIVSSRLPELAGLAPDVLCAESLEDWLSALQHQVHRTDRAAMSARRQEDDWEIKVRGIRRIVDDTPPRGPGA